MKKSALFTPEPLRVGPTSGALNCLLLTSGALISPSVHPITPYVSWTTSAGDNGRARENLASSHPLPMHEFSASAPRQFTRNSRSSSDSFSSASVTRYCVIILMRCPTLTVALCTDADTKFTDVQSSQVVGTSFLPCRRLLPENLSYALNCVRITHLHCLHEKLLFLLADLSSRCSPIRVL